MNLKKLPLIMLGISLFFFYPNAFADKSHLTVADYLEYEQVRDPQISPDGKQVIYTRRFVDQKNDRWASALWIMDADGSRHRFLHTGSNARWSPTGDRILFIANGHNKKPQLFIRWMNSEGAVSQVTRVDVTPSSPKWSPDGTQIAFVAIVPAADNWNIDLPESPDNAEWTEPPRVVERLHYRQDYVGFRDPGYTHLFVVPAESGTARQLTDGEWNVGAQFDGLFQGAGLSWMPNSEAIVFDGLNEPDADLVYLRSHIYSIDISSEKINQLTEQVGFWTSPEVSADGRKIAYTGYPASDITYEMPRAYVMNVDGSDAYLLMEKLDRPINNMLWAGNNRGLYFSVEDQGYTNVLYTSLNGDIRSVTEGQHTFTLSSMNRSSTIGVGTGASFYKPGDIYSFALSGRGSPNQLTAINDDLMLNKVLGAHEEMWFEASDGNRSHGWLVKPPDFDPAKKYPLLMEIHGGPFAMYQGRFDFRYQVFASNGFIVLYTNPRGSTGYGETFAQAIDHAYPSVDYLDLMGGVDAAIAKGHVDEKRMYVGGCSGGGVLSSWVIGHTDRFAAAAVRCPVTNWLSMAGTTDVPFFSHSFFKQPFWIDPSDWLKHSSLMYVGNVKTPTLIMTGEHDLRTPMAQSEEYFAALKMRGIPTRLLRFNDEYHGTGTKPSNYMRTMLYMISWYNKYTKDDQSAAKK